MLGDRAGVDILHPIQAQAKGMSAQELAQYKNDIAFVGGIDVQGLLFTIILSILKVP